jgi:hypothetical protein
MEKKPSSRLQVAVSSSLYEKIEVYADVMGIGVPEAARHLMLRGLEQVQMIMSSKNSVDALNRMTEVMDRGLDIEAGVRRDIGRKMKERKEKKAVGGLVTPPQNPKNETKPESKNRNVKDMFAND